MILEGSFREYLKISKFLNIIRKMRNNYTIAGEGRVGEQIAFSLLKSNKDMILTIPETVAADKFISAIEDN